MNDFLEKWKTDNRFKVKTKLGLSTVFVALVALYAIIGTRTASNNSIIDALPKTNYDYQMSINLNDKIYNYDGTKTAEEITINKTVDDQTSKYVYKDNKYYKTEENVYVQVEEKEVYEAIEYNYLSLNTIDKYLKLSTKKEDINIVYLSDIIIGNSSEEYITIETKEDYYKVDYTQLMKLFKNDIEKLTVEIIIE